MFQKLDLILSSGEERETPTLVSALERAVIEVSSF
jgi:hypothetical protein